MRIVTYGAACSLDGFIAGPAAEIDWLHFSPDVHALISAYWKTIDVVLMGRKTWSQGAEQGADMGGKSGRIKTYVFSRTMKESPAPGVELVTTDPGTFVHQLKRRKGRGICVMGGGDLARTLFQAGVIDEVGLNIHPILLGAGVPLFPEIGRRLNLELLESRVLDGGCVLANYRVLQG
jgi:dihydrofolate reductase